MNKINNQIDLKALVVEDSLVTQRLMSMYLGRLGFSVEFVENGGDAIRVVKNTLYDIVFLDVMLPVMDGFQICKKLKADKSTKDIPVIMLTSKDGTFDKIRGRMAGSDVYLTKPVQHSNLMNAVGKFFPMEGGSIIQEKDNRINHVNPTTTPDINQRERLQRERLQRERLQRERLQRERLQRERLQRERLQREKLQRERNNNMLKERVSKLKPSNLLDLAQRLGVEQKKKIVCEK